MKVHLAITGEPPVEGEVDQQQNSEDEARVGVMSLHMCLVNPGNPADKVIPR